MLRMVDLLRISQINRRDLIMNKSQNAGFMLVLILIVLAAAGFCTRKGDFQIPSPGPSISSEVPR